MSHGEQNKLTMKNNINKMFENTRTSVSSDVLLKLFRLLTIIIQKL